MPLNVLYETLENMVSLTQITNISVHYTFYIHKLNMLNSTIVLYADSRRSRKICQILYKQGNYFPTF